MRRNFVQLRQQRVAVDRFNPKAFAQGIMVLQSAIDARLEGCRIGQISHANRPAANFVLIGRANTATSGADLGSLACRFFACAIKLSVNWQDERCILGDHQRLGRDINALFAYRFNFLRQMPWIENDAISDHAQLAAPHHARRQRIQFVDLAVNDKGVTSVVAPLKSSDNVGSFRQPVYDFAFPLVTPLGANDYYVCHGRSFFNFMRDNRATHSVVMRRAKPQNGRLCAAF